MLEQEVTDYLGRGHYERREESNENRGYRNGYRPARMDTAEGRVKLQVPQVRESAEPYRSRLVDFLRGNSDVLERLAVEMYTRGLSTRDIEDAFREVTGDLLLSRTAVSAITDQLWADYKAFSERDLSCFEIEYLFLDGVYESLRCLAHTLALAGGAKEIRNAVDKVPDNAREEVKAMVHSTYYAPNREVGEMIAKDLLQGYQGLYPSAMKSFTDDLEACWSYLRCPAVHHRRIRTTNLLERAFVEQKRHTKTISGFWTEKSCLKLVFATLPWYPGWVWQTSQRWRWVRMSEFEQQQLLQLRAELGLSQPTRSGDVVKKVARLMSLL